MHYVLFVGIFGLPVLACVGMLVTRVLDTFAPETPLEPDRVVTSGVDEMESGRTDLADTFITAPVEENLTR
jgi:hypothetical protein